VIRATGGLILRRVPAQLRDFALELLDEVEPAVVSLLEKR
jgi:hypothetical protein